MLYEILRHIRNFFPDTYGKQSGIFTISEGVLEPSVDLYDEQYYLIEGSIRNDGVHRKGDTLRDESFQGTVTPLMIPQDLLSLVAEIEEYVKNDKASANTSESFGGYSYSRAQGSDGRVGWQYVFASRLRAWRKI